MLIPARRVCSVGILLFLAFLTTGTSAQHGLAPSVPPGNFDIRTSKTAAAAQFLESARAATASARLVGISGGQALGLARLQSASQAEIEINPALGTPEIISARPGARFLTGPGLDRGAALRAFASSYADALGVTPVDVQGLELVADYMNPAGNMGWAELEQRLNGIPVFQGYLRGGFTAKGELVRTTGLIAPGLDAASLPTTPSLQPSQAVALAAASVGWPVEESMLVLKGSEDEGRRVTFDRASMAGDPQAWLLYFPLSPGSARLAWTTTIIGDPDGYLTVVDAEDGTILFRKNLTNFQTQSVTLGVYITESPAPSSPTPALPGANYQAPPLGRRQIARVGNEPPNTFNNTGWMPDGVADSRLGNNVAAGLDLASPDGIDAFVSSRTMNANYDPSTDPPTDNDYRIGEVANMFFWTNVFHDRLYLLGFNEQARNFQFDNFGRGGAATDHVLAQGQDFSATNNANFLTLPDGTPGRMQMFIFAGPNPDRSSGLDADVMLHELTHGVSNRLHANASGLNTTMSGGMGEGWSDFYARALLSSADEDINGRYPVGGWVTNQLIGGYTDNYYYGIRRFPYAVMTSVGGPSNRPFNPLTFADIDPAQIDLTDGAYPPGPIPLNAAFQVHNIGEVWASALLEVRARFIARLGFTEGNGRVLQFVTDGMKLDPASPTILQGRNSILAAASAGGTVQDVLDIWAGFAARGMGFSAQVIAAGTGTVVEAFDMPGLFPAGATIVHESAPNGMLDAGEFVVANFCATNTAPVPLSATGTLLPAAGVAAPSIPQSFAPVAPGETACQTYYFTVSAACGTTLTASLQLAQSDGIVRTNAYPMPVGTIGAPFMTENFDGVAAPALPAGWSTSTLGGVANLWATQAISPDTAPNRVFAAGPNSASDNLLVSPLIAVPAVGGFVSFRSRFDLEAGFDGGVLEISVNGGAWQDIVAAGGIFTSGGYTHTISVNFSSPIAGRQAWSGNPGAFVTTIAQLPASAAGQAIQLRWRIATDVSVASTGWAIDTVVVATPTCAATAPVAQPPQALYVDSVVGNTVRLRWTPPAGGLPPAQYVIEGGINPGQVLASLPTGHSGPIVTFTAPTGAFFVRVHALSGASKSLASNEVRLYVNFPAAPSAPASLLGMASGSTLNLAWRNTFLGGAPTSMLLDVAGSLTATIPLGVSESFAFTGVPGGAYTLSLRAVNGAGVSGPSNPVSLTFPVACTGVPAPPTNVLAYRVGATAFVIWDPPASGPAPSAYRMDVSGSFVGSLAVPGLMVSSPIGPGTYNISVAGTNPCGTGAPAPTVVLTVP